MLEERQSLPSIDRLSVLAASILLAYALLPFIKIPERSLELEVLGVAFHFEVDFSTIIAVTSAALAAAGTDWLLSDHPRLRQGRTFTHWLLPALTAWVIGVPLNSLAVGPQWWAVFAFGGLLLVLVLIAEYIAVDSNDSRYGPAAVGLTAVAYAMFLILTITLVAAGSRLYLLLPALVVTIFLVTLRNLSLRLSGRWCFTWSAAVTLVIAQVITALHYWPITPLRFGLVVIGLAYTLTSVAGSLEEGRPWRSLWLEPVVMLAALFAMGMLFRG